MRITVANRGSSLVSGKWSAGILLACLVLTGILVPVAAHLPHWVEAELVLAAWWLIWMVTLAAMLHRGCEVADDMAAPERHAPKQRASQSGSAGNGCGGWWWYGDIGADGCSEWLVGAAAVVLLAIGIWLFVEFLLPGLAFFVYLLIRGMMARVVNDRRDCQGSPPRAAFWGAAWATLYTLPLGLIVWAIHAALKHAAKA